MAFADQEALRERIAEVKAINPDAKILLLTLHPSLDPANVEIDVESIKKYVDQAQEGTGIKLKVILFMGLNVEVL